MRGLWFLVRPFTIPFCLRRRNPEVLIPLGKGLNRGHNNVTNTKAAAIVAKDKMANLIAIELGNEPECLSPFRYPLIFLWRFLD
jgi:hypothetical protein